MTATGDPPRALRTDTVRIPAHLNGPPQSGHGGYTAAIAAAPLRGAVAVDLRRPVPLDRPLQRRLLEGARVELRDGDELIAQARETEIALEVPPAPGWDESMQAAGRYAGLQFHPFDTCFGCGTRRRIGDGLRIFPGTRAGGAELAAPWVPHESLARDGGRLPPEMIWAALDCPAGWASSFSTNENFPKGAQAVTAQLAARIDGPVHAGRPYTILSWPLRAEGRKVFTGAVLYDEDGAAVAIATALMVVIPPRS
jgi:hypothetical protein